MKFNPKKLHLDNEYRRRWEEYLLADGTIKDSRKINWRNVEWEKVIQVTAYVEKEKHVVSLKDKPNFKGFMRFRWGGREAQYKDKKFIGYTTVNIWTIGWADGKTCFLRDIDFYTGKQIKRYQEPLMKFKNHIHPRLKLGI